MDFEIKIPPGELQKAIINLAILRTEDMVKVSRAIERSGMRVEARAKQLAPVDHGGLVKSIKSKMTSTTTAEITANVDYAGAVEFGSKAHVIKPKKKRALAFKPGAGFRFWDESGRVVVKKVRHPGTKAQPYLTPALEADVPYLTNAIKKILEEGKA